MWRRSGADLFPPRLITFARRMASTASADQETEKVKKKFQEFKQQMNEIERQDCENFLAVCQILREEAITNQRHFSSPRFHRSASWFSVLPSSDAPDDDHQRFDRLFLEIQTFLTDAIEPLSVRLFSVVSDFDFRDVRANGYRSLLHIVRVCCVRLLTQTRDISASRGLLTFRAGHAYRELAAFVAVLGELRWCLHLAWKLAQMGAGSGELFLSEDDMGSDEVKRMMMESELIEQKAFYGRSLGFQYSEGIQRPLQGIVSSMAAFADFNALEEQRKMKSSSIFGTIVSVFQTTPKYFLYAEKRAEKIVQMTRHANIDFCKSFWNITESPLLQNIPMLVCPPVEISEAFQLPPTPFSVSDLLIQPPVSHTGPAPVDVRLISYRQRVGQGWVVDGQRSSASASAFLVIHCHGGGFVAQSSRSHEVYLRHWAKQLDCPILSVDYSLAPQHPFPRALEEAFFAYCWALRNCARLGSSGERILVCGDSAGGNLVLSLCLRAAEFGVRLPDAVFLAYTPVMVQAVPSPARLLAVMDPLLPAGILLRCLLAYAGIEETSLPSPASNASSLSDDVLFSTGMKRAATWSDFEDTEDSWSAEFNRRHLSHSPTPLYRMQQVEVPKDPFMSPFLAQDQLLRQLPPTAILATHLDPVLDDCVEFAKRIDRLGGKVALRVLEDLPHGFLNLSLVSKDAKMGSEQCVQMMRALLEGTMFTQEE